MYSLRSHNTQEMEISLIQPPVSASLSPIRVLLVIRPPPAAKKQPPLLVALLAWHAMSSNAIYPVTSHPKTCREKKQ